MARRISRSQLQSKLRQAQQKQRQAISKINSAVRKHNQAVRQAEQKRRSAISRYNQEVRAYNARVRANRSRLQSLISRLRSTPVVTNSQQVVVYRRSVESLHDAFGRLESRSDEGRIGPQYNRMVDLAEREAANSAEVATLLSDEQSDETSDGSLEDAALGDRLRKLSPDLDDRWRGAVFSLAPSNPDAARHFCTSSRELFTQILELTAPDSRVFEALPNAARTDRGNATRRSKIRYLLHTQGMTEEAVEDFVEADLENVVKLFHVFNDGTHGSAGTFDIVQLKSVKKRVEDGLAFLLELVGVTA